MMKNLLELARRMGVEILNTIEVNKIRDLETKVELHCNQGVFTANKVVVATNGFASQLLQLKDVKPARAQVLITKPIEGLKIKGAFHYQQGYYYFRNIDNRILLGGGRNLDFEGEATFGQGTTPLIQDELEKLLKTVILPDTNFEIDRRWSGIMGVGNEKKPIIRPVSTNVLAAVRMGGMGVAIGSLVGEKAAQMLS
jgi:glycine/D-amino acid oxidase-like deaminating enzyme